MVDTPPTPESLAELRPTLELRPTWEDFFRLCLWTPARRVQVNCDSQPRDEPRAVWLGSALSTQITSAEPL